MSVEGIARRSEPAAAQSDEAILRIAQRLQTSLVIEKLLEIFSDELQRHLPHDGLGYFHTASGVELRLEDQSGHQCRYELELKGQALGTLVLWRATPFSASETDRLESLLVALLYPLRNALLYQQALDAALTDPVTGIHNRAALDSMLAREVELARRHGHDLALIMIDIDRFKNINDTYGHLMGDEVLRRVAAIVGDCVRSSDMVSRYGGEEFIVVLRNTELFGAALLAQRIRAAIERMIIHDTEAEIGVTVSIGVTSMCEEETAHGLIDKADRALYEAKRQGRNRVVESAA